MRHLFGAISASLVLFAAAGVHAATASPDYRRLSDIAAPDGHWDLTSWDADHGRVIVAHGNDVLVVDPGSPGRPGSSVRVRAIGKVDGAHGVLALPGGDRILVTSAHDNTMRILDESNGTQLASIPVVGDPDATVLSNDGRTAYVMGADSGAISVVDLDRQAETARITVKPGLEAPVLFGNNMLAVNDEDLGEIELVNLTSAKMTGTIALPGCEGPTGLAYAPAFGLALSSCANGKAALVNLRRHKVVKLLPIGSGPDTVIWDARKSRFLVPCGRSGSLSVIKLDKRGAEVAADVPTDVSARTAALDPATGRVYLPAARFEPAPAGERPTIIVPGTFHLVVLAPQ